MTQPGAEQHSRTGAWLWGLTLLLCAGLLAYQLTTGARWDTRIISLLPETQQSDLLLHAEQRLIQGIENDMVVLVSGQQPRALAEDLRTRLQEQHILQPAGPAPSTRPDKALAPYRHQLLADTLAQADVDAWVERGLTRLFSPGLDNDLRNDPFGLQDAWLVQQLGVRFGLDGDFPVITEAAGRRWLLISGQLSAAPYDLALQNALLGVIEGFKADHPEAQLLRGGLVFHAAAGAKQARQEISTIGIGSLTGILLVLWLVFRNGLTLVSLVLPLVCGLLVALPVSWAIFGSLSLVTLAFGASLIGIAVDYALHLQCARHLAPEQPLKPLWPALWLALLSSLAAFLIQLATPFPGLQQMAIFAALGLTGAWLTMRLWLPLIPVRPHPVTAQIATRLARLRFADGVRLPWLILLLVGLLALGSILARLHTSNDLRQLNPSPVELIAEQQQIQLLLQRPGAAQYLIVSAPSEDQLLIHLEQLDATLSSLQENGHLSRFRHLAQAVPSAQRQQQSREHVSAMLEQALPRLAERAGLPANALSATIDYSVTPVTLADWFATPLGTADQLLWLQPGDGQVASLVLLGEVDAQARQTLKSLHLEGVHYHDRVAQLGQTLGDIRNSITTWLGVAMAGLALLLGWRYRLRVWRVLLPPLGAVLITLAVLAFAGAGLTLFHLLGLLLVLGIGLDAGIFSVEHEDSSAAWLGITLSCIASLLAFGLLSFSATPALAHLGITCLIGLATAWLLVPFARATITPLSFFTSASGKNPHGKAHH